jgi:hypothetical protein
MCTLTPHAHGLVRCNFPLYFATAGLAPQVDLVRRSILRCHSGARALRMFASRYLRRVGRSPVSRCLRSPRLYGDDFDAHWDDVRE